MYSIFCTARTLYHEWFKDGPRGMAIAQDNAPLLNIPGRTHPVEIFYTSEPERDALRRQGHVGCSAGTFFGA